MRRGKVTAPAVVEEHLRTIAGRDGSVGAFRRVRAEEALAEAAAVQEREDLAELPLAGVPIAVKDNVPVRGEAMRCGSAATPDTPAAEDHPVVARLREAGAVVVGITNVPELCLAGFSDSVYGVTRNPWDLERTSGGSSGGSAAAVASGMVPLAHGADGLGSLRIPAACCGIVSIKPGLGVVPPPEPDWHGMSENGPLATTVADLALALAVMAGDMSLTTPGETESLRVGDSIDDYPGGLTTSEPVKLKIAVAPRPLPSGFAVDREFQEAVHGAARILGEAGHTVVEHDVRMPLWTGTAGVFTWFTFAREDAAGLDRRRLERRTRALARTGRVLGALGLDGARGRDRWRAHEADQWFGDADVLVSPTLAMVPPRAERWGRRGLFGNARANLTYAPATAAWNMAGWPAMTVPYGRHSTGLPIGVQLVAAPGGEAQLLTLAAHLEAAAPWPRHAPPA
ncbi:amidase [Planobispora longispora]|uniref:Putative amidase AmiB2 n=1 Tax=Planobispora longispora TaxID=28887 RepID=A0A8J3RK18_9ACTN|nr:amidase [Planobispora longispora]GIH76090.1 putative amidase AmiB2 [Planobispora longispora]